MVLDIGAYHGDFRRMIGEMFPGSKVVMFEPAPSAYKALCEAYPEDEIYNFGVCDTEKEVNFVLYDECPALNRVTELVESIPGNEVLKVKMKALHDLYQRPLDIVKIDVEGQELNVLKGARKLLEKKQIRFMFFECGSTFIQSGYQLQDVISYLRGLGYTTYRLSDDQEQLVECDDQWNEHHFYDYLVSSEKLS